MSAQDEGDLVEVFATTDASQVALAKSLLERDKVPFYAQGDIHSAIETRLPVRFLVAPAHRGAAAQALKDLR